MRKIAFLLLAAAVIATPAMAGSKKKVEKMTPDQAQRDASWRFVRDGFPLVLPSWAMPIYFHMKDDEAKKAQDHKDKKKVKM